MSEISFHNKFDKRACPVCDSIKTSLLYRQTFDQMSSGSLLQGYDVVVCDECGCGFADRIPAQKDFDTYYRDMSKYEYQDQGGKETEYDLARFKAIVESLINFMPDRSVRIFDVGCATGKMLSLFKEQGYPNVVGLDPSPLCAESANKLYGIQVLTGSIYGIAEMMRLESTGTVILTGVLEHIRDIHNALVQIRGILVKNGIIFIEVPDVTEFASWPDAPFQEFSTEHINFFSTTSLDNLLGKYGFEKIYCNKAAREQSFGTVMPVITAIYKLSPGSNPYAYERDFQTQSELAKYIKKSQRVEHRIQQTIAAIADSAKPIVVWGVGTHTLHLLSTSPLKHANIKAFVDSNPRYQGKELNGIPILAPGHLRNRTEAILISSRVFQPVIEKQIRDELKIKNEIIKLYEI